MKSRFVLKVDCEEDQESLVTKILEREPDIDEAYWQISIYQEKDSYPVNYIQDFIKVLNGKYDALHQLGIQKSNISVWYYYEYDQECNIEILPEEMKLLSDNGIVLCISCWQNSNI
jgi:hypothetical protein